jgi:hypothetical protein
MHRAHEAIAAAGGQVVAIGQGTAAEAASVCAAMDVGFPCLGDPDKASYRAFGLPRGGWREIVLDPIRDGSRALEAGYRVSLRGSLMAHSDWFQLPGVAIVDRAGTLRWLHRARHSGDIPPTRAVLEALSAIVR